MALPNSWTTISVGMKIMYDDHMYDLRVNADYLDNNVANRTHNAGVLVSQDVTADNDQYSTADNPHNVTADNDQYATADNPHYLSALGSQYPGYDGTAYISALGSQYPGYDGSHLYSAVYSQNTIIHTANYPSNCITIYNSQCEAVGCTAYNGSVNSSNYGSNLGFKN
jgi:hypothetical protein